MRVGGSERKPETPLPGGDGRRRRSVPRRRRDVETALLLPDAQTFDELPVPRVVLGLEVVEQPATLTDELQKSPAAVEVLLVRLEVLGEHVDALGEQRHLHLGGTGVGLVGAVLLDDSRLALAEDCHVGDAPSRSEDGLVRTAPLALIRPSAEGCRRRTRGSRAYRRADPGLQSPGTADESPQ